MYDETSPFSNNPEDPKQTKLTPEVVEEWVQNKNYTRQEIRQVLLHFSDDLTTLVVNDQLDSDQERAVSQAIHDGIIYLYQAEIGDINERLLENPDLARALADLWPVAANLKIDYERDQTPITKQNYEELLGLIHESVYEYFQAGRSSVGPEEFVSLVEKAYAEGLLANDRYNSLLRETPE